MIYKFYFRDDAGLTNYSLDPILSVIPDRVWNLLDQTTVIDGTQFDVTNLEHWKELPAIYKVGASRLWVVEEQPVMKGILGKKEIKNIIAQQGNTIFLVDIGEGKGRIVDVVANKAYEPFNIHSIIARGYWNAFTSKELEQQVLSIL